LGQVAHSRQQVNSSLRAPRWPHAGFLFCFTNGCAGYSRKINTNARRVTRLAHVIQEGSLSALLSHMNERVRVFQHVFSCMLDRGNFLLALFCMREGWLHFSRVCAPFVFGVPCVPQFSHVRGVRALFEIQGVTGRQSFRRTSRGNH
jgi:hypothetical protein